MVQSINEEEKQLDFAAAMDWLERESKMGNSLVINLTRPGNDDSSSDNGSAGSDDSSTKSNRNSDDSNYMEGGGDSKCDTKRELAITNRKIWTRVSVLPIKLKLRHLIQCMWWYN